MAQEKAPVVPARNDLKKVEVYARSRANELAGKDPDCEYQWMSLDPANPSYHGKFERKHEVGDIEAGFALAEPWSFVHADEGLTQGRPREDMGKPVDTAMRHGDLVLMKTSKQNYAVYQEIDRRKDAAKSKRLRSDQAVLAGGQATQSFRVGFGHKGSATDLLHQSQEG